MNNQDYIDEEFQKIINYLRKKKAYINAYPRGNGIAFYLKNKKFSYGGMIDTGFGSYKFRMNTKISCINGVDINIETQVFVQSFDTFEEFVSLHKKNWLLEGKYNF